MKPSRFLRTIAAACVLIWLPSGLVAAQATGYDPLLTAKSGTAQHIDLVVQDGGRSREIPLRIFLPEGSAPAPVVLFSHGLGGNREGNPYLGEHWSARGYVVVMILAGNFPESQLLVGRMDLSRVGMSGHSFGAVTTQAVSGQRTPLGEATFTDARIKASVVMSPNAPKQGDAKTAFGRVQIPWLLMTGTHDVAFVGEATMETRLAVFPALPPGGKYEIVLFNAEHNAFGDRALPGENRPRNPNHHRVVLALSTAFWDAYLRGDAEAKAWLDGAGATTVLEPQDRWQRK
ncbi:MAG: dienelactone hydrolase [Rhodocyclaceae bacterium]|nr:dienelactone hydrolase [Rhodocyclaceae bacterium]